MLTYYGEEGYYELLKEVLNYGQKVPDRTGVGSRALFGGQLAFMDVENFFPFVTKRPTPLRMAFEEFWMFVRGEIQTKQLEEKGIHFWKGNTSREFLDNRGMTGFEEGSMGFAYGWQFRNFGSQRPNEGVDQLREVYAGLSKDPYGRRYYVTFWNPAMSHMMALTPCWHSHQFVVIPEPRGDKLHLKMVNRSVDLLFGCSFAYQQYALYLKAMAKLLGMKAGNIICDLSHIHIYENQVEYVKELLQRSYPQNPDKYYGDVQINKELNCLEDLINLSWEDIHVEYPPINRSPFNTPKPEMAV